MVSEARITDVSYGQIYHLLPGDDMIKDKSNLASIVRLTDKTRIGISMDGEWSTLYS